MVYPTLSLRQDLERIEELASEGSRKAFTVTETGLTELSENAEAIDALIARLTDLGETQERIGGGPVKRAMENLHGVIKSRLTQQDVTKDMIHDVAAMLDATAQKIERL